MKAEELRIEIGIEFEALQRLIEEIASLQRDSSGRDLTVREKTAASSFLAQFYTGIENVLKRLTRFHGVVLPSGENWHFELFQGFCPPGRAPLPILFDDLLAGQVSAFRRFRHVVHHGYGFQLDWDRMRHGVEQVEEVFLQFRQMVEGHLQAL